VAVPFHVIVKAPKAGTKDDNIPLQRTSTTKTTSTMLRIIVEFISSQSIATHSQALALFAIYISIRCYRVLKFVGPDFIESDDAQTDFSKTNSNCPAASLKSKPKLQSPISYGKTRD